MYVETGDYKENTQCTVSATSLNIEMSRIFVKALSPQWHRGDCKRGRELGTHSGSEIFNIFIPSL